MKRARRIRPVRAWALVDDDGYLYAPTCDWTREAVVRIWRAGLTPIRVEIRPVPPRRRAKRKA